MTNTTASAPFPPFRRVSDLLRDNARQRPQANALADDDSALDWAALDALVDRVAASLQQAGLQSGDVVAVWAASSVRYAAVYLGALRAGVVVAPLAPSVTPEAMASMLGDAQARLLFADAQGRAAVPPAVMEGAGALLLVDCTQSIDIQIEMNYSPEASMECRKSTKWCVTRLEKSAMTII